MAYFDFPADQLKTYQPDLTRQPDFDSFWAETLTEAANQPLDFTLKRLDLPYTGTKFYQATYAGWNGALIAGTYAVPDGDGPFPAISIYHGYGGMRPDPANLLTFTSQGYAVLATDVRGQTGESGDAGVYPGGHRAGYMTQGIGDPHTYFYRGAYVDCVRAVQALAARSEIDKTRIGATGGSQGGALTLSTSALCTLNPLEGRVRAAFAEIPFLCHFERAVTLVDTYPFKEVADYLRNRPDREVDQAFRTLSYFDCMNLADKITVPTQVTLGLMDLVCPPSTIFAAYNRLGGTKELFLSRFGEHATFPGVLEARARWFKQHLG